MVLMTERFIRSDALKMTVCKVKLFGTRVNLS